MVAALALLVAGALERFEAVEAHMGTLVRITVYAPDAGSARRGFAAAFARIAEIDARLSDYKPGSELSRACADGATVRPSADLLQVVSAALALSESTGGAFDITVGRLTKAWRAGRMPDERARAASGFRKLRIAAGRIVCDDGGMELDAGAIAKGYAGDQAIEVLARHGLGRALVAVSGDVVVGEPPPGEPGWSVRIAGSAQVLRLAHAAVSTSGDREQFRVIDGVRYSHILDPRSGRPLAGAPMVTVVARRGIDADSIATALCVLGTDGGLKWLERHSGIAARFVRAGEIREWPADSWPGPVFRPER